MEKINKLGYSKVEILIIVILLGIVSFITINKTSYAFTTNNQEAVREIKSLIEYQAQEYGLANLNIFEENIAYITVKDLVEAHYLMGNEEGLVTDPTDNTKNFNDNKIKLEYNQEKNEVKATIIDK